MTGVCPEHGAMVCSNLVIHSRGWLTESDFRSLHSKNIREPRLINCLQNVIHHTKQTPANKIDFHFHEKIQQVQQGSINNLKFVIFWLSAAKQRKGYCVYNKCLEIKSWTMNLKVANNNAILLTLHLVCLQAALHNKQMSTENFFCHFWMHRGNFRYTWCLCCHRGNSLSWLVFGFTPLLCLTFLRLIFCVWCVYIGG